MKLTDLVRHGQFTLAGRPTGRVVVAAAVLGVREGSTPYVLQEDDDVHTLGETYA